MKPQVEIGTFKHQGREFSALGSVVDHENGHVVGYPKGHELRTWDGTRVLGTLVVRSSWPTPHSHTGSRMYAYHAMIDGRAYYGRGFGDGMLLRLRAYK